ncbi:MAG TPA: carbohydrate ABC transporter permease [Actinomycetota bacterium]|nr:carbohydrate ABC transporter permease [Actinomycetota bacterium]
MTAVQDPLHTGTGVLQGAVKRKPRTAGERVRRALAASPVHLTLWAIAVVWLAPTVGLLITSFRPQSDSLGSGWWTVMSSPRFTLENYQEVLTSQGLFGAFLNSLQIAIPATLFPLLVAALAGYALAWIRFPFRDTLFLLIITLMMIPVQIGFIPLVRVLGNAGLTRGFVAVWLAHGAFALPFGIFLLRNFFITLPGSLLEAARIDGASEWKIFRSIVIPLSVPAIASLGIFQFLWVWNDLLMALVFIQNPAANPMTRQIQSLLSQYGTEWHLLAAGAFLLMVVPLIVFFSLQRFFVQGLLAGGVK